MKPLVGEDNKIFNQTIRVKSENVREIPSMEVPYFNTRTGSYQVARSKPIPIIVRPTRIVTARDLEERAQDAPGLSTTTVRSWEEGILFNYGDASQLLDSRPYGISSFVRKPVVPVSLAAPLLVLIAAMLFIYRKGAGKRRLAYAEVTPAPKATSSFLRLTERLDRIDRHGPNGAAEALTPWR